MARLTVAAPLFSPRKAKVPPGLEQAAAESAQIGREALDFYKGEYGDIKALTDQVVQSYLRTQEQQMGRADDYINYMKSFEKEVMAEGSPEQQEQEAAAARAQVARSYEGAKATAGRDLARMGVNPNSGRFGDFTLRSNLTQATDEAGAMNTARTNARLRGINLRAAVLPGAAERATDLGMRATAAAVGTKTVPSSVMDAGFRTALAGFGLSGGLYSNIYSGQLNAANMVAQEDRLRQAQLYDQLTDVVPGLKAMK
jgi:hypothetical protein